MTAQLKAIKTITTITTLTLRKCNNDNDYDYALISEIGETVGWLTHFRENVYTKIMIDNSFKIFDTFIVVE